MASNHLLPLPLLLLLLLSTTTSASASASSIYNHELDSLLTVLRLSGHTLFSNAISTSDLLFDLFLNSSFTLFAPQDSSLFALDMTNSAPDYTSSLRCHVIPLRLSHNQLRRLPSGFSLPTLLPYHRLRIDHNRPSSHVEGDGVVITIDGVRVVSPGVFYSRHVAVHGLGGILNCFKKTGRVSDPGDPVTDSDPCEIGPEGLKGDDVGFAGDGCRRAEVAATPPAGFSGDRSVSPTPENVSEDSDLVPVNGVYEYAPAYSPEMGFFRPANSPWTAFTEPPLPEFSEEEDPMGFSPAREKGELSRFGVESEEEEREKAVIRSLSLADLAGILEDESEPLIEGTGVDCFGFGQFLPRGFCLGS